MASYLLTNVLDSWILPPGGSLLLLIVGIVMSFFWRRTGRFIVIIGCISLWLLSAPIVAYNFIGLLQNQYPILADEQLKENGIKTAIVILGGGDTIRAEYGNKQSVSNFTFNRVQYGAYLYHKTHLPIIVSGGKTLGASESVAELMAQVLNEQFNIPVVLQEDKSFTTADESKLIAAMLKKHAFNRIYLVTDAWHMPRSVYIFKCAGIQVIPAPMGHYVYGPGYSVLSFLPNIDALYASSLAMHEWIGLGWYYLRCSG